MAVLHGSQCESVPFDQDLQSLQLSRSLVETCTRFLACMVDTQDYICQMKNTYVKELWPKVCAEITESNSRLIVLEKELSECKQEKEESRRYHMQEVERLRMAYEDERSTWIRDNDSLRRLHGNEGRCEVSVASDLCLQSSLPNHAENFEFLCKEREAQNQMLQRIIEARDKSNSELNTRHEYLRKQLQIRTEENEELKKALELACLKMQVVEQQRLFQEDSDDRYKRERRLSLKKQRHLQMKSGSPLGPWRGEQGVEDGSLTDLEPVHPETLLPVADVQVSARGSRNYEISVAVMKSPACTPPDIRHLAPGVKRIDLEANAAASERKLAEHPTEAGHESEEIVHRLKFHRNAEGNGAVCVPRSLVPEAADCSVVETIQGSLEPDKRIRVSSPEVAQAEHLKVHPVTCAPHQAEAFAKLIERPEPVPADNAKQPCASLSCNPGLNEEFAGNGTSRLAGVSRGSGELASSPGAKEPLSFDRELKQPHETSLSDKTKNSPKYQSGPSSDRTRGLRSKERKWKNTRSRTEGDGDDLHDSFLSTPREIAMANIKSRRESGAIPHEDPPQSRSAELRHQPRNKGPSPIPVSLNRGKREADLAAASYEWTDDELKVKQPASSKATAVKSTWSTGGAANTENGFRPSSGACTSFTDKEKQAPSSRALAYKYNEPVRKKREREQLEATDCLQCRKFYDAVLAEDAEGVTMDRCEHHDAVSRHRYKYLPPGTPAGFWNIGFDSEL